MIEAGRRAIEDDTKLPTWARVILRVMFREGPITLAMLVMLGVILGMIPSPYLGKPLEQLRTAQLELKDAHDRQTVVLEQIRDDFRKWQQVNYRRTP